MGNPKLVKPDLNSKSYNVVPMFNWWAIQLYISRVAGSIMFEERISKGKKKDGKEGKAGPFDFCYYGCAVQTHTHVVIVVKQGNWQKAQQSHRGEKPRGSRQGLRRDQSHCCQILFGGDVCIHARFGRIEGCISRGLRSTSFLMFWRYLNWRFRLYEVGTHAKIN